MRDISEIGRIIRRERKNNSLTQSQLGQYAGTGLNFISQLERGKGSVRLDKLLDVMKILGLKLELKRGTDQISVCAELTR